MDSPKAPTAKKQRPTETDYHFVVDGVDNPRATPLPQSPVHASNNVKAMTSKQEDVGKSKVSVVILHSFLAYLFSILVKSCIENIIQERTSNSLDSQKVPPIKKQRVSEADHHFVLEDVDNPRPTPRQHSPVHASNKDKPTTSKQVHVIVLSGSTQSPTDELECFDVVKKSSLQQTTSVAVKDGKTNYQFGVDYLDSPCTTEQPQSRYDKMKALAIQNTHSVTVLDALFSAADYTTLQSYIGHIQQHHNPHVNYVPYLFNILRDLKPDDPVIVFENPKLCDWTKGGFLNLSMKDGWLDDKTIKIYTNIVLRARENWLYSQPDYTDVGKWHISSSYFFQSMFQTRHADPENRGHFLLDDVKKWYRKINFHAFKGQLIPINVRDHHWAVLKVSFEEKRITYIDSLARFDKDLARKHMAGYIRYYCEGRSVTAPPENTPPIAKEEWITEILPSTFLTQQQNGNDCGVFCCMFIDLILLGHDLRFNPSLATFYRRMMFRHIVALAKNLSIYQQRD